MLQVLEMLLTFPLKDERLYKQVFPHAELQAVILACQDFAHVPFNLYTDSAYVYGVLKTIETAYIGPANDEQLFHLLHELRALLQQCQHPYFVSHLRSHSGLPGPLAEGNSQANALVSPLILQVDNSSPVNQAIQSHSQFHQNSRALRKHFHITREQARQIVKSCSKCAPHLPVPSEGVNHCGLHPLPLWQMDVTFHLLDKSVMSMLSLILTLVLFLPLHDQGKQHTMS
jgi:hypothetical protein